LGTTSEVSGRRLTANANFNGCFGEPASEYFGHSLPVAAAGTILDSAVVTLRDIK
jgi:hypothetical protein